MGREYIACGISSTALIFSAIVLMSVALGGREWFNDNTSDCSEGLWYRKCSGVNNYLTDMTNHQVYTQHTAMGSLLFTVLLFGVSWLRTYRAQAEQEEERSEHIHRHVVCWCAWGLGLTTLVLAGTEQHDMVSGGTKGITVHYILYAVGVGLVFLDYITTQVGSSFAMSGTCCYKN